MSKSLQSNPSRPAVLFQPLPLAGVGQNPPENTLDMNANDRRELEAFQLGLREGREKVLRQLRELLDIDRVVSEAISRALEE